jgi:hypothetical protein
MPALLGVPTVHAVCPSSPYPGAPQVLAHFWLSVHRSVPQQSESRVQPPKEPHGTHAPAWHVFGRQQLCPLQLTQIAASEPASSCSNGFLHTPPTHEVPGTVHVTSAVAGLSTIPSQSLSSPSQPS